MLLLCLVTINMMVTVLTEAGQMSFFEALKVGTISQIKTMGVMFLLMPVFLRDTLKMSNRFAGPMYRLRIALKKMAGEDVPAPIKFRDGDFWQEAADDFNTVRSQFDSLKSENAALKAELDSLRAEQIAI